MKHLAILFTLGAALGVARADQAPRRLTFEAAISLALGESPDLLVAKEAAEGADAHASGISAHRGPALHVDFSGNLYTKPYKLAFGSLGSFTLYEQTTTATSVSVTQPITGLAYLTELVGAARHQAAAAHREYDRARLEVAYKTAEGYLRVLEARATADVAHQSVTDLQSELDRAVQLRQADTYTDVDVLRFKSAKAAADRQALRADSAAQSELAGLVVELGLPEGTPIEISDDLPATPPPLAMQLAGAQERALGTRPELAAARERIAAAVAQRRSAWETYFPDVRAVAIWNHLSGTQPFAPENEELLGVRASWNVWDWGSTHDSVVEAEHAQSRAMLEASSLADQVKLDVHKKWLDAKTEFDSLAAATTQQQAAEEAYRLQKVKLDAGAATTTDVLDAQTEVARARLVLANERLEYYVSLIALARSIGDLPAPPK